MKPHPSKATAKRIMADYRALLARAAAPSATEAEQAAFWAHKTKQTVAAFRALLLSHEPGSPAYYAIARRAETGPGWLRAGRN